LHFNIEPAIQPELEFTLSQCGQVRGLLREAGPDENYYFNDISIETLNTRMVKLDAIATIRREFHFDLLHNFSLSIPDDLFMEVLLNNLRNEITSYQAFIEKFKKREFNTLVDRINTVLDESLRDTLEDKLAGLNEIRIRDRLLHSSVYKVLNNERMTPLF
jgi:hypothetical protein